MQLLVPGELITFHVIELIFQYKVMRTVLSVSNSMLHPDFFDDLIRDVGGLQKDPFEPGGLFDG